MSYIGVFSYLRNYNLHTQVIDVLIKDSSRAAVTKYLQCGEEELVKCHALVVEDNPILIVSAGDKNINEEKYRNYFEEKIKKINYNLLKETIGHTFGGLCPFNVKHNVKVYLDKSLKELENIYVSCGSPFACVKLEIDELEKSTQYVKWIDVC